MRVLAAIGGTLLILGIAMGLAKWFIDFLPYSLYYGGIVVVVVAFGIYNINKHDDEVQ